MTRFERELALVEWGGLVRSTLALVRTIRRFALDLRYVWNVGALYIFHEAHRVTGEHLPATYEALPFGLTKTIKSFEF